MTYFILINLIYFAFINNYKKFRLLVIFTSLFLVLFISFRFEVGGDWDVYKLNFENYKSIGLLEGLKKFSYKLPVIITHFFSNFTFIDEFAILGFIFCYFYIRYLNSTNNFFLSLFITFPVLLVIGSLGYVYQAIAVVICWQVLINYRKITIKNILFYVGFASLFHLSALLFVFIIFPKIKNKQNYSKYYLLIFLSLVLILIKFDLIIQMLSYFDYFYNLKEKFNSYLFHDYYKSNGAITRLVLFVPSFYILYFYNFEFLKNKINHNLIRYSIYLIMFIIFTTLIIRGSLSFAFVDRLMIYFIFLQVILTNKYYEEYKFKNSIFINLIVYFFPVIYLFIWINYSQYIDWWSPYQNKLFVPLRFLL